MSYRIVLSLILFVFVAACNRQAATGDAGNNVFTPNSGTQTTTSTTGTTGTNAGYPLGTVTASTISPNAGYSMGTQEHLRAQYGDRVFFPTNQTSLDQSSMQVLQGVARWMIENPQRSLRLEGHADERGTREYNLALGDRRATSVRTFLVNSGVSANRLTTVSYGKERPASSGAVPSAWAQNRRSVFVVY